MPARAIVNATNGAVLHKDPAWGTNTLRMATGMMFRKPRDECVVFLFMPPRREVVTMWFVFGPLDIVALDGTGTIMEMRECLAPWQTWRLSARASAIVELPAGTIARSGTRVGHAVRLPPVSGASMWRWYHYAAFLIVQFVIAAALAGILILCLVASGL